MKTLKKKFGLFMILALLVSLAPSCKNDDPSIVKIFVRSNSNELLPGVKVVIVGDVNSNPATISYVDTVITNNSGFAEFNLEDHYAMGDKEYTVAYFDVFAQFAGVTATGEIRSRIHTTAVETIYMP